MNDFTSRHDSFTLKADIVPAGEMRLDNECWQTRYSVLQPSDFPNTCCGRCRVHKAPLEHLSSSLVVKLLTCFSLNRHNCWIIWRQSLFMCPCDSGGQDAKVCIKFLILPFFCRPILTGWIHHSHLLLFLTCRLQRHVAERSSPSPPIMRWPFEAAGTKAVASTSWRWTLTSPQSWSPSIRLMEFIRWCWDLIIIILPNPTSVALVMSGPTMAQSL